MNDIKIKTLPITVNVVKVGNRQMTKAVFSQIAFEQAKISAELVDPDSIPDDWFEIYGWINYLPERMTTGDMKKIWLDGFAYDIEYAVKEYRPREYDEFVSVLYLNKADKPYLARGIAYKYAVVQTYPQLFIAT